MFWPAAGSEAPRCFRAGNGLLLWSVSAHPKAVSPLRFATAVQIGFRNFFASMKIFRLEIYFGKFESGKISGNFNHQRR
jgi:hypothetical protein